MLISEAKKLCPELVLADGEDLSAFRDVSKKLHGLLRSFSWNKKVERLGLDEVFLDVSDIISYNMLLLNRNALQYSFFFLERDDPEKGFSFDASAIAGCVSGTQGEADFDNPLYLRLVLASHLARFLRMKIEGEGYTSACGISVNKLLSKLVGSVNKPRNQTTLLSFNEGYALAFMDTYGLRSVPGFGSKITHTLESHVLGKEANPDTYTNGSAVTVGQMRTHPDTSPPMLEKLLGGPGAEKGIGDKIWGLLHGVDPSEVKTASNVPTQISIEDTYQGLNTLVEIERELLKLSGSLIRRMHVDLLQDGDDISGNRWLARPKTLRLTTRPKTSRSDDKPYNFNRTSRSQPLPNFVFSLSLSDDDIVKKLVSENILPMFYTLNSDKSGWNIGLLNICVANMTLSGTNDAAGSGRDISVMFKRQDDVLRQFRPYNETVDQAGYEEAEASDTDSEEASEDNFWGQDDSTACAKCGHFIPPFAVAAHDRYHALGD